MFDPQSDPLGLGLQARARENRFRLAAAGRLSPIGPLPDPQWEGFFQAVSEANPGKRVQYGQDNPEGTDLTNAQSGDPNMLSRQLGTLSLSALRRLRSRGEE
jgi:hypothetical protein